MKVFGATIEINASPHTIWQILTDAPSYPEWDPGMLRLEGKVAPGDYNFCRWSVCQMPYRYIAASARSYKP
jgi:hypothetical protein